MEKEEIIKLLADESFKGVLKDFGYETADDVTGLKNKRDELLGSNRALKERLKEMETKYNEIDFEEIAQLKEKLTSKNPNAQMERELAKMKEQLDKLLGEKSQIESAYNQSLIKESFANAMKDANIDPLHYSVLTSAYLGKAKVEADGNNRSIIIDDGGLGLSPQEFFKSYAAGDGKHYVAKAINAGASSSSLGSANRGSFSREDLKTPEGRKAYLENREAKIN